MIPKHVFEETLELKRGHLEENVILMEMGSFMLRNFGIQLRNFYYETLADGREKRLNLIYDGDGDREKVWRKLDQDTQVRCIISDKFIELCQIYEFPLWNPKDRFYISYYDLQEGIKREIIRCASEELHLAPSIFGQDTIRKVYLEFTEVHIFYETNQDIKEFATNGLSDSIEQYCSQTVKKYDEFQLFQNKQICKFVSNEILNRDFSGNMFYYTRR